MSGYVIQTVTLSSRIKTTTGPAGLVRNKDDMNEFMTDYYNGVHKVRFMLFNEELSREWVAHNENMGGKIIKNLGSMFAAVLAGDVHSFTKNAASVGGTAAKGWLTAHKDPFNMLIISRQLPSRYSCGRYGVSLG